jgi:DTW domain-containing protein
VIVKRQSCLNCLRPKITCICHLVSSVNTDVEVLILQHPLEVTETKGTARLLHLSLPNSKLLVGEVFDVQDLTSTKHTILLYPVTQEDHSLGIAVPPKLNQEALTHLNNIHLIIIDGTWRKSRKILCNNAYLQTLPRLVLQDLPAGQYSIRKARKPHQLSSLEAATVALTQLEADANKFESLMKSFFAFNAFIALQMDKRGKKIDYFGT